MEKRIIGILMLGVLSFCLTGCSVEAPKTEVIHLKAVKTMNLLEEKQAIEMQYIGTVTSKDLVKYSFKVDGKIDRICVAKGALVHKGDVLAVLDKTDLGFQVSAAKAHTDLTSHEIEQIKANLDYYKVTLNRVSALYKEDAASKDQLDQAQLAYDSAYAQYAQASSQSDAAKTDYAYKSDLYNNAVLRAEQDGVVAEKLFNENERVPAYHPVLVIRSGAQIIKMGIPQQELGAAKVGDSVDVTVDDIITSGKITSISEMPDEQTRTYTAEVTVSDKTFKLGAIAKLRLKSEERVGLWIPLRSIQSEGEDYVYVVKNGRALKKTISIVKRNEDFVLVSGLAIGDQLVIEGMSNLDDGFRVKVSK